MSEPTTVEQLHQAAKALSAFIIHPVFLWTVGALVGFMASVLTVFGKYREALTLFCGLAILVGNAWMILHQ